VSALELSLVIPAYNEEARLPATLESAARFLSGQPLRWEIVVVDDGSTDGTVALCRRLAARIPGLRVVETRPNRGKGHAVRVGMRAARGAVRVMCDADGSTPVSELPKLLGPIGAGAAVVIGSRYLGGGSANGQPLWRRIWSRLAHALVQRALVPGVRDAHCGFKAFTAAAAEDVFGRASIDGWTFDLEALALAQRLGHPVHEVAVEWRDDQRSRVRPLQDLFRVIGETALIQVNLARGSYGIR
jgi:dolichyl-phosphate beta-glucosyltransferase